MLLVGAGRVKSAWTDGWVRSSAFAGDVPLAGLDGDGLVLGEIADPDLAAPDACRRRRAAVLDEPDRPDHRGRAVLALGAEPARAVAPQAALALLLRRR